MSELVPGVLEMLVCPACHGQLTWAYEASELVCTAPQCGLEEVGSLDEEACGAAATDVSVELDRCRHTGGALREQGQAASSEVVAGAFTSAGSAALATSTSAVNAAASLTAISARFLRSTSTPATLRPWISRL